MIRKTSRAERKVIQTSVEALFERYRMNRFLGNSGDEFKQLTDAIGALPTIEKNLITSKYLSNESEYLTDYQVYTFHFDPPIAHTTYSKIRDRALFKLALRLDLCPELNLLEDKPDV